MLVTEQFIILIDFRDVFFPIHWKRFVLLQQLEIHLC